MKRNYRNALVLLVCAASLCVAAPGYSATRCAWSTQTSPCPVKRSMSFVFWGKASDATPTTSLSITTDGFGRVPKVNSLLADEVGNDETVRVKPTTRFYLVGHDTHKRRIGATAFWTEVDAYDDATIYVTGQLATNSFWDDDPTIVSAGVLTIDISEVADTSPDLSGAWMLNGQSATLTPTDATDLSYSGQSGGATFTLTENGSTVCITGYAYTPVPNNATTFTCGLVSDDEKTIGPLAWSSPVWGTGTWTFTR